MYLPDRVVHELENERKAKMVDEHLGKAFWFSEELEKIDPRLELCLAHENADDDCPDEIIPGFWHVRRKNDGINDSYMPLTTPDGEWAEPMQYHLDQLRERDMWRDGGVEAVLARVRAREAASEKRAEEAQAERIDELAGHIKALDSPGVLIAPGVAWTPKVGARRG